VLESSGAMIGAVRFIRINVFDPSIEEENTGSLVSANPAARLPADRQLVYPWIGAELVEDDFRETRNQDQIERTDTSPSAGTERFVSASQVRHSARIVRPSSSTPALRRALSRPAPTPCS